MVLDRKIPGDRLGRRISERTNTAIANFHKIVVRLDTQQEVKATVFGSTDCQRITIGKVHKLLHSCHPFECELVHAWHSLPAGANKRSLP